MMALPGLWLDRQSGVAGPDDVRKRTSCCLAVLQRIELQKRLEGHNGCVNTVHFSPDGTLLVSGSDDQDIRIWDWQAGRSLLRWASGHHNNVFQARIMPESHNETVVSCAADGQVRVAHLREGGGRIETRRLARHQGRAHKLAIEPGSPSCFYSCGEDGEVRHFDLREPAAAGNRRLLVCRAAAGRPLELNSIHCNPRQPCQFVVGGADEQCRVYDQRKPSGSSASLTTVAQPVRRLSPRHLRSAGRRDAFSSVHVTCAVFSQSGEVLATYNDEDIYLFATDGGWRRGDASGAAGGAGHAQRSSSGRAQQDAAANSGAAGIDRRGSGSRGSNKRGRASAQLGAAEGTAEGGEAAVQGEEGRGGQARRRGAVRPASYLTDARRASAVAAVGCPAGADGAGAAAAAAAHARVRAGLLRDAELDQEHPTCGPGVGNSAADAALHNPEQQRRRQEAWEGGVEGCGPAAPGVGGPSCSTDAAWLDRQQAPAAMSTGAAAAAETEAWTHASGAAPAPETPVAPLAAGHTPYRDARLRGGGSGPSSQLADDASQRPRMILPPPVHTPGRPAGAELVSGLGGAADSSRQGQAGGERAGAQAATQAEAGEQRQQEEAGSEGFVGPPPPSGSEAEGDGDGREMRGHGEDWRAELMELAYGGSSGMPSWDQGTDDSGSDVEDSSEADSENNEDGEEEWEEESVEFEGDEELSERLEAAGALLDDSEAEGEEDGDDEEGGRLGPSFGSLEDESGDDVVMKYTGHRNSQTVKGVNFMGWSDEWVVSGSDCGHVFIWDKKTGRLGAMVKGDRHVVNCLEPHPYHTLLLATSGIEDDIKLWAPTAADPRQPGAEAEETIHTNTAHRGRARRRMVITPQLLRLLLGERLEVRRRAARAGAGEGGRERAERGEGNDSEAGEGEEEEEEQQEGEESEREFLLHVDGSDEEDGAEALRRIAPGECSLM